MCHPTHNRIWPLAAFAAVDSAMPRNVEGDPGSSRRPATVAQCSPDRGRSALAGGVCSPRAAFAGASGGGGDEGIIDAEQDSTLPRSERWVGLDSGRHRGDVLIVVGVGDEACLLSDLIQ
jgi:hypothetical protein